MAEEADRIDGASVLSQALKAQVCEEFCNFMRVIDRGDNGENVNALFSLIEGQIVCRNHDIGNAK